MSIITTVKSGVTQSNYYSLYPDQYISDKAKQQDDFVKINMDYFSSIAYAQYQRNKKSFVGNYDLVKGILRKEDFYEEPASKSFIDNLVAEDNDLPGYVKHYPILNPPLNTLVGELSKRPDTSRVKAFDEDSRNEELSYRTDILQQMIMQKATARIYQRLNLQGTDPSSIQPEQIQQLATDNVADYLTSYTSLAEQWGNNVLEALKVEFNLKEKSEDAFRDLLLSSREYYHIYETTGNSTGFTVDALNPKNVWSLSVPDKKYSRDWYAGGLIEIMELSEIIEKLPQITKEEIDHLRSSSQYPGPPNVRPSGYGTSATGIGTIIYDTFNPAIENERLFAESEIDDTHSSGRFFPELSAYHYNYGNKICVVTAYWKSKKKVGKLSYYDQETAQVHTTLVDENYVKGSISTELTLEWRYANQWMKGIKVGADVYHVEPYELLPYCPIIGVVHEVKNTRATSLIDLMKPYQMIYNVCLNQLWKLLEKEKGKVILIPLRHIPIPKDADAQDALDMWELEAKERGAIFVDDSPENARALSAFNQYSALDLTRSAEIQSRYNLAVQMKMECWELVGLSRERLGNVAATQTATGVNTSLSQSYAQTEVYFIQHEYVLNELYQAVLDAAQHIESAKATSTISYINGDGENQFIQINGEELKLKDLKVFVTARSRDQAAFQQLQQLAQPALQNGASLSDIAEMYTTDSMRKLKDTFKRLKNKQEEYMQQQQQLQQQQLTQAQQQFLAGQQAAEMARKEQMINENYERELDRVNKKEIAIINTFARQKNNQQDLNGNGAPDMIELSRLSMDQTAATRDHNLALQKIASEKQKIASDRQMQLNQLQLEKEKLKVKREEIASKEKIARTNKNRFDKK